MILPNGVLQINNVTLDDEGQYKCVATNPVQVVRSKLATLTVLPQDLALVQPWEPTVVVRPASQKVVAGDDVLLECLVEGFPLQITWKRKGGLTSQLFHAKTNTPFISPNSQSLRTELHFQFIRFAAAILQCASVCFHTEHRISAFWKVRFKKRSKIEQQDIITPMHCLAFPSALFGAPFNIDNRTVADCGFWLEYASKTPLEVVADLPHRMCLFWLRCQIMRLRSVHIKPHYSQNAFDSALLAWYERGINYSQLCLSRIHWDWRSSFDLEKIGLMWSKKQ